MIEQIDIINLSHYDLGYTDHPVICRRLQSRYLDQAIDLAADPSRQFYWTVESNNTVLEWWQEASSARRDLLVELARAGRIEVCAMPFNHGPTMDARQWRCCARWLPAALWQAFRPRTIMQNDVNGFSRAGVAVFLDAGVEFLWMGLNNDTGGSPVPQPSASWWQMPDGRRIFIWHAESYPSGYFLFEPQQWRCGPLPPAADTRYRPPDCGDILVPSAENLRRAHAVCRKKIEAWHRRGYVFKRVAVSMTNMWRIDNDPPCALLPDFIAAWNAAGLAPRLAMTTPTQALTALRAEAGDRLPVQAGEWPSWWANGAASTPRELSASRQAKRLLDALDSPLYRARPEIAPLQEQCTRQLCFFDEHTWGSWNSAAMPDSLDTRGQFAEKAAYAYRPLAMAELALGDANRLIVPKCPGLHVVNPYPAPYTGWVMLTADCLRGDYAGVLDETTGAECAFVRSPGVSAFFTRPTTTEQFSGLDTGKVFPDRIAGRCLRFWVEALPPASVRSFTLRPSISSGSYATDTLGLAMTTDQTGWPTGAAWADQPLFLEGLGDFCALEFQGIAPRWTYKDVFGMADPAARHAAQRSQTTLTYAVSRGAVRVTDTGPTIIYEQDLDHPRLRGMCRILEIHKRNPRVQLHVSINRLSKPESAEVFYIRLPLAARADTLRLTSAGMPFIPDHDQIPGSCRDHFAIDGRVLGADQAGGNTVVECYDTALVALGGIYDGMGIERLDNVSPTVYAMLYNNIWYTNYAGDETGRMDFAFDLYHADPQPNGYAPQVFTVVQV